MSTIRSTDFLLIDDLFEMGGGYVLNFSNQTFFEFFRDELKINIDDPRYAQQGTSKGKRLRSFLRMVDDATAARTLQALWEYREAVRLRDRREDKVPEAQERIGNLIHRLGGQRPQKPGARKDKTTAGADPARLEVLTQELVRVSMLAPQPRGYAFESFLKDLFDAYGLEGREPFRIRGEQIDGSFLLASETYLLEARWQNGQTDAADLRAFNGKVEEKAAWARGLFISQSGFTEDGLHAFGRGKRIICMDGLDLYETLSRKLHFGDVLARKVRRAAEAGTPFSRVRDLFSS